MAETFTPGAAMNIAYISVTSTTGSHSPVEPLFTLAKYNAHDPDLPSIKDKILNNKESGLPHYQRTMNPNALKDLGTGWSLQKLADLIFDESVPQAAPQFASKQRKKKKKRTSRTRRTQ